MRFMTAFHIPALVLLFSTLASSQTTWYVDQASTAFPLGTQANPFTTFSHALAAAQSGDTITLHPGSYTASNLEQINRDITIQSIGGPDVTELIASMTGLLIYGNVVINGLRLNTVLVASNLATFDNCSFDHLYATGSIVHMTRCHFPAICDGIGAPRISISVTSHFTITDCRLNSGCGIFSTPVIQVDGVASIRSSVVLAQYSSSINISSTGVCHISSCVFPQSPFSFDLPGPGGALLVENTIVDSGISFNTGAWGSPAFFQLDHCNVPNAAAYGNGCFTADPLFVDAPNGDFHLMPGSPCINAGTNSALFIPATDIDGEARIQDGIIDVGVDEADASLVVLGPCGAGNVGIGQGGPFNLLKINNSSGGIGRRVDVSVGQSITISMDQPITNPFASPFIIYGLIGAPVPSDATVLPSSLGTMCFPPSPLVPGYPLLFTLANSVSFDPVALVPAIPAPWSASDSNGLPFPFQITFQGVIFQDPATVRVTNGVILNVQ